MFHALTQAMIFVKFCLVVFGIRTLIGGSPRSCWIIVSREAFIDIIEDEIPKEYLLLGGSLLHAVQCYIVEFDRSGLVVIEKDRESVSYWSAS